MMRRIYLTLLRLYPRDFRAAFGREMVATLEKISEERPAQATAVSLSFAAQEFGGLLIGSAAEWIAKLTTDTSVRGRTLPDLTLMRPAGVSWENHYDAS